MGKTFALYNHRSCYKVSILAIAITICRLKSIYMFDILRQRIKNIYNKKYVIPIINSRLQNSPNGVSKTSQIITFVFDIYIFYNIVTIKCDENMFQNYIYLYLLR